MTLEAALEANTAALRELTAALLASGALQNAQAQTSPAVQAVVRAQKDADAKKSDTAGAANAEPAAEPEKASKPTSNTAEPQPWAKVTAELYAELKDAEPDLENLRKAILGINSKIGRPQADAVLARFGAQAISAKADKKGLDAKQYPEVFALALRVLSGEVDATLAIPEAA